MCCEWHVKWSLLLCACMKGNWGPDFGICDITEAIRREVQNEN